MKWPTDRISFLINVLPLIDLLMKGIQYVRIQCNRKPEKPPNPVQDSAGDSTHQPV
jgi:hypothetical protein